MDRLQQKHDLFVKLGKLFGPLQRVVEYPNDYDEQEKAETIARYCAEITTLYNEFHAFAIGQPGHIYAPQNQLFHNALWGVQARLADNQSLNTVISTEFAKAVSAIEAIPVPKMSVILEAGSPFTAYCRLRDLCEVDATKALCWLDPYFGPDVFHRYIRNVRLVVPVTLITCEPSAHSGNNDKRRWTEFVDASRLYAKERGTTHYRLIVQANLHDRWVMFDEKRIYSLGGSAKDAGDKDYFTITNIEGSPENLQKIQTHIDTGSERFGPNALQHI